MCSSNSTTFKYFRLPQFWASHIFGGSLHPINHGVPWVISPRQVVPVLLEERHQEVDGHQAILPQLAVSPVAGSAMLEAL